MSQLANTALSVLDLAPIRQGGSAAETFQDSVALAQHTERLGYQRYWLAEHHNMDGVASSATAVLIGQLAAASRRIRVGAGGVMLTNHAPLTIAEQFGTLAELYPGRIDLGLGRAPGTDGITAAALCRGQRPTAEDDFPGQLAQIDAAARETGSMRTRTHLALARAAFLIETRKWVEASAPVDATDLPREAIAADLFAIGFAGVRSGNRAMAAGAMQRMARLQADRHFVWIKRRVSPKEAKAVELLALPGVELTPEPRRFYPSRELAAHVLGFARGPSTRGRAARPSSVGPAPRGPYHN